MRYKNLLIEKQQKSVLPIVTISIDNTNNPRPVKKKSNSVNKNTVKNIRLNPQMPKSELNADQISTLVLTVRGQKVLLDRDLSCLYGIETRVLKQAVRRNRDRFPEDFMFELSSEEFADWRSQFVTSKEDLKGLRYAPMAFTEQGIAMLSSVLNAPKAVAINIAIIRAFVQMRHAIASNRIIEKKLKDLQDQTNKHDRAIVNILQFLQNEVAEAQKPRKQIGFKPN